MNIDEQLTELKDAWQDSPAPDTADLARKIRRARRRGWLVVTLEVMLTAVGVGVGLVVASRTGWFATAMGVATIALSIWALQVSLSIRRRAGRGETGTVRGQVEQLRRNAQTNLKLVSAGYVACVVAAVFVFLIYTGSQLGLPGAPSDMGGSVVFAMLYLGTFALACRFFSGRVRRELDQLRRIEASLAD